MEVINIIDPETLDVYESKFRKISNIKDIIEEKNKKNMTIKIDKNLWWGNFGGTDMFCLTIDSLILKTWWELDEKGDFTPVFCPSETTVMKSVDIKFPNDIYCVFKNNELYIMFGNGDSLPFGNLYDTGKVCLGDNFRLNEKTMIERIQKAVNSLSETTWNDDLMNDFKRNKCSLIKFPIASESKTIQWETNWNIRISCDDNIKEFVNAIHKKRNS